MPDEASILDSTKKAIGIEPSATAFDSDIIMHINTAFFSLQQLGLGPASGFMIEDSATKWGDYLGEKTNFNAVKSYIYLRVRLLFDPPTTSFALDAISKQIQELEWRLNIEAERYGMIKSETAPLIVWAIDELEGFPDEAKIGEVGIDPETGSVWRVVS
jgi:hypothetical protein